MSEENSFVAAAYGQNGRKGASQAALLVDGVVSLFAGGDLTEEDRDAVMKTIQEAYWISKEESKRKYTPKKYRKTLPRKE